MKTGNEYRMLYKTPVIEFCTFIRGALISPMLNLLRSVLDQVRIDQKLFHECPYKGKVEIRGLDVKDESFFIVYPSGIYRSIAIMSNSKDNLTLTFITAITTPNKHG